MRFGPGQGFRELAKDFHIWVQFLTLTQSSLLTLTKQLKKS